MNDLAPNTLLNSGNNRNNQICITYIGRTKKFACQMPKIPPHLPTQLSPWLHKCIAKSKNMYFQGTPISTVSANCHLKSPWNSLTSEGGTLCQNLPSKSTGFWLNHTSTSSSVGPSNHILEAAWNISSMLRDNIVLGHKGFEHLQQKVLIDLRAGSHEKGRDYIYT